MDTLYGTDACTEPAPFNYSWYLLVFLALYHGGALGPLEIGIRKSPPYLRLLLMKLQRACTVTWLLWTLCCKIFTTLVISAHNGELGTLANCALARLKKNVKPLSKKLAQEDEDDAPPPASDDETDSDDESHTSSKVTSMAMPSTLLKKRTVVAAQNP